MPYDSNLTIIQYPIRNFAGFQPGSQLFTHVKISIMRTFLFFILCFHIFASMACESAEARIGRQAASVPAGSSTTPDGMAIFRQYCITCHGADGKLGLNGAKDLSASTLALNERIQTITYGKKVMTPFNEVLSPEEIKAVAEYTFKLAPQK